MKYKEPIKIGKYINMNINELNSIPIDYIILIIYAKQTYLINL